MGSYFSCCGRRRKGEYKPLLEQEDALKPPQTNVEQVSDILAALSSGKLPSEVQMERFLQAVLKFDMLSSSDMSGHGPLSAKTKLVLDDARELIEAILQFGMEKNYDDCLQELYHFCSHPTRPVTKFDVHVAPELSYVNGKTGPIVNQIPSVSEIDSDFKTAMKSFRSLTSVFLTSSSFRLLLADLFTTSREILADTAAMIGGVADTIEIQAAKAEQILRPDENSEQVPPGELSTPGTADGKSNGISDQAQQHWEEIREDAPFRVRNSFVSRWQELLAQVEQTPAYRASLLTILSLMRKYYSSFVLVASDISDKATASDVPHVRVSTNIKLDLAFVEASKHLKTMLSRLASYRSLDPLFQKLDRTLDDLVSVADRRELRLWFEDVGGYLAQALNQQGWAQGNNGRKEVERLYDEGQKLLHLDSNAQWLSDLRTVSTEIDNFFSAMASDRSTQRILKSAHALAVDVREMSTVALGVGDDARRQLRHEIRQDIFVWLLPRMLRLLRAIPMPRIEFKSPAIDGVIDSLILASASASLTPDHLYIQSMEEIRLDLSEQNSTGQGTGPSLDTYVRTKIHIDGLRVNAHGISYYVNAKGPMSFLGWEDNGLLDVDVGDVSGIGDGLMVDLELETPTNPGAKSLFEVVEVKLDVSGLKFRINESKHWIVNKLFLQPFLGPVVRGVLTWILEKQFRDGLQLLDHRLYRIYEKVSRKPDTEPAASFTDYWDAFLEEFASQDEAEEGEPQPKTQVETYASLKGIVHKTTTQPPTEVDASNPPTPTETVIAVGAGEQILPGKGGPVLQDDHPANVARETAEQLGEASERGKESIETAVEEARHLRQEIEHADTRLKTRREKEHSRGGWRSSAFDLF